MRSGALSLTELESVRIRKAGRPTAQETEQLNETIVRAALRVFTAKGIAASTMEQIAEEAGTTRRSIAHRFASKDDLVLAVIEQSADEYRQEVFKPAAVFAGQPLEAIKQACRAMFERVCQDDFVAFHRLVIAETAKNIRAGEVMIQISNRFAEELDILVARAQREGVFAHQISSATAIGLIGVFLANPLNRRAFGDPQFRDEERQAKYFESLWALVAHASA